MGSGCSAQPIAPLELSGSPQNLDQQSTKTASPVARSYIRINVAPVSFRTNSFTSISERSIISSENELSIDNLNFNNGKSEIVEAVRHRNVEEIVSILAERPHCINERDNKGYTALLAASICGCEDIVQILLDNGAKVDIQDRRGATSLFMAAVFGHVEVVRILLSAYANIGILTNYEASALYAAENHKRQDVVKELSNFRASQYRSHLSGRSLSSSEQLQINAPS